MRRLTHSLSLALLSTVACFEARPVAPLPHPDVAEVCNTAMPGADTRPYRKQGVVLMLPDVVARTDSLAPSWLNDEWLSRGPVAHWLDIDGATARLARAAFEQFVPATGDQYRSRGTESQFYSSMETDLVRCPSIPGGPDFLLVAYTHLGDGSESWYNVYASWPLKLGTATGFRGGSYTESGARALLAAFRHQTLPALPTDSQSSGRPPQN